MVAALPSSSEDDDCSGDSDDGQQWTFDILASGPGAGCGEDLEHDYEKTCNCKKAHSASEAQKMLQFPPIKNETCSKRLQRSGAYDKCWSALSKSLKDVTCKLNAPSLDAVLKFTADNHTVQPATTQPAVLRPMPPTRTIPAAILTTGGAPAGDHVGTLQKLAERLQTQGAFFARLDACQLSADVSVVEILSSVHSQMSGSGQKIGIVTAQKLKTWYISQTNGGLDDHRPSATSPTAAVHRDSWTRGPAGDTCFTAGCPSGTCPMHADEGGQSAPASARVLRALVGNQDAEEAAEREEMAVEEAAKRRKFNAIRPVVLMLEWAEAADVFTLQDLLISLAEVRSDVPLCLVLVVSSPPALFLERLPRAAVTILRGQVIHLPSPARQLAAVFDEVILGRAVPAPFPGPRLLRWLLRLFHFQDNSMLAFSQALQVACQHHFSNEVQSIQAARLLADSSSTADRPTCKEQAPSKAVLGVAVAWAAWVVGVRCFAEAASVVGNHAGSDLANLAALAATPGFIGHVGDGGVVDATCSAVRRLSKAAARKLALSLLDVPRRVWVGDSAFKSETENLQALLRDIDDPPAPALDQAPPVELPPAKLQPQAVSVTDAAGRGATRAALPITNPRSKAVRNNTILNFIEEQAATAGPRRPAAAAEAAALKAGAALERSDIKSASERLSEWLHNMASTKLATPPCELDGAEALCMDGVDAVEAALVAAPRQAVHRALTSPASYLDTPCLATARATGEDSGSEEAMMGTRMKLHPDAAICYQLRQQTDEVGAGGWFVDFCSVAAADDLAEAERHHSDDENATADDTTHQQQKGGSKRKSKKVGKGVQKRSAEEIAAAAASRRGPSKKQAREQTRTQLQDTIRDLPPDKLQTIGARFQAATGELQHAGLVRGRVSTRLGTVLSCVAFQPPDASGGYGTGKGGGSSC